MKVSNVNTSDVIYKKSAYIKKLITSFNANRPLRIAFLDIDFTLSSNYLILPSLREKLYSLGFITAFVTSRTEEMVMSSEEYILSRKLGFNRPKPLLHLDNGKYSYVDPRIVNPYLVDPDLIIASTGTKIFVRQITGGYALDTSFDRKNELGFVGWREKMMKRLQSAKGKNLQCTLPLFEDEKNYITKKTNVFPPEYRIQVEFTSVEEKKIFLKKIKEKNLFNSVFPSMSFQNFHVIDDSNAASGRFVVYLTPKGMGKKAAVQHVLKKTIHSLGEAVDKKIKADEVRAFLAGDGLQDLPMLLEGGAETDSVSLLVGGSKLGNELSFLSQTPDSSEEIREIQDKLRPLTQHGHYLYSCTFFNEERTIYKKFILGNDAFPMTKGPETILAFLNTEEK